MEQIICADRLQSACGQPPLGPELREKTQELFLNMHLDPNGIEKQSKLEAQKFIVTTDEHFQSYYEMQKNVEIYLSTQKEL